ncbi:LytTR family DNA-binding domain-containing protein [Salibacter sp.]|uniref:LytR/AlgR family response regulator transcription factor n=1 Tax=Salibacter sp. TaxID=2010995 RepID=UPI0028706718|nr:LytTR family DNA-binding domain-containing protein [Salibacter sp.]MDR9399342.1 LytTR family DNA-binding domain-containing protein [Salibacter sp.]MDR9488646.1 LytTR family DNA-binding domain-containing protein [Salibacter sp.]
MRKYNVLAVNSGVNENQDLESYFEGDEINLTSVESSGQEALRAFEESVPDVVLIDTKENGGSSGYDVANELSQHSDVPILFLRDPKELNNGSEKNKTGFHKNYVQYPLTKKKLKDSIEKAVLDFRKKMKNGNAINEAPLHRNVENHSFFVKIGNKLKRVETNKIEFIEVEEKYCSIFTENRQIHVKIALKDFIKKLPESTFIRVHRNYVINTEYVNTVQLSENIVIVNDRNIPFSRTYKENLINTLNLI